MTALAGIRVIDLGTVVMSPYAARLLGDMGADVIKVESISGDSLREIGPMRHAGMGPMYLNCNRNKRSIALDLKSEGGRHAMKRLLASADVFLTNTRPKALRRLGLDYDACRAMNPNLLYVSAVGFGQSGPYADRPAYDDLIQGASAMPSLFAMATRSEPRYVPLAIVDRYVGTHVANAILAGLVHRSKTGQGQFVEVPMFETMVEVVMSDHSGGAMFDPSLGPPGYPRSLAYERRPFRTRDGYVCAMLYLDHHWRRFGELIGRDLLGTDPRFSTITSRTQHAAAVHKLLEEILVTRTTAEWLEAFERTDIPATRLHTLESLADDPHLAAVEFFAWEDHPTEGRIRTMRPPSSWSQTPPAKPRHAPRLGEHTREMLLALGYSEREVAQLIMDGAVRQADATGQ